MFATVLSSENEKQRNKQNITKFRQKLIPEALMILIFLFRKIQQYPDETEKFPSLETWTFRSQS